MSMEDRYLVAWSTPQIPILEIFMEFEIKFILNMSFRIKRNNSDFVKSVAVVPPDTG